MTKITINSVIVVEKNVVSCDLDGEAALLNINNGVYYGLDHIGAKIWNLIQKPTILKYIVENICHEYEVDKERCKGDVLMLIVDLLDNGLVIVND